MAYRSLTRHRNHDPSSQQDEKQCRRINAPWTNCWHVLLACKFFHAPIRTDANSIPRETIYDPSNLNWTVSMWRRGPSIHADLAITPCSFQIIQCTNTWPVATVAKRASQPRGLGGFVGCNGCEAQAWQPSQPSRGLSFATADMIGCYGCDGCATSLPNRQIIQKVSCKGSWLLSQAPISLFHHIQSSASVGLIKEQRNVCIFHEHDEYGISV